MKIEYCSDAYIIYLNKYNVINLDFSNTKVLESDLKKLLLRLKKYYSIDIKGYYNITLYIDKYYGAVLKLVEDNNYYDYFDDSIAVRMKKIKTKFRYEVDDISYVMDCMDKLKVTSCGDKIHLEINDNLNISDYLRLLEMSNIIYN